MYFSPESSLVSICGQRILSPFEHNFASCAQTLGSHHYLGGHTRSEEAPQRRIFSSLALFGQKQLFEGDGSPLEPQDCTLMKVSRRSHPLCPRRPKSVTSDLWRQVWPPVIAWSLAQGQSELRRSGGSEALRRPQLSPWIQEKSQRRAAGTRAHGDTVHYESPSSVSRK